MVSSLHGEEEIFDRLQKHAVDPKVLEERKKAVNERISGIYQKAQARLAELLEQNSTLPCTISSVQVLNAPNTRRGFLEKALQPLLSENKGRTLTLSETLEEVAKCTNRLNQFDIFEQPIGVYFDKPSQTDPSTTPTDLSVYLATKEKSRLLLKTGTDLGNAEGSAYGNLLWRNIFGGAENLNLNASLGTRTRSSYQAVFETPILSDPNFRWEAGAVASDTKKPWASHEEVLKGAWTKFRWLNGRGHRHEIALNGLWRQITGLAPNASTTVREDAGDSVKTSISHIWVNDRRDNPILPTRGFYTRTLNELAGCGPLKGDVAFWKSEVETQTAIPVPVPGIEGDSGISFTSSFRAGLLYPLGLDSDSKPQLSKINDRFQLGGPTDVRGFRLSGLGPREGPDALGGDLYAAGSANIFFPLPRVGADKPFRLQAFINAGRLLALRTPTGQAPTSNAEVRESVCHTIAELQNGLPSVAAGVGLVYAHPAARFELNFSLPLVVRKGEEGRKGLQLGIGISFL
ncbi:sorting assembly machinery subunit [Arthroderma uncinatum]|uniref:sorting assembly machinery subunit n=1 Tax=Arthroderma uncinatum TaxID=74035 RepID=UPI00144A7272|nr:sorting assembly machinery subunit [Arthroderma uncinatum]KAF3480723.1 sorting assembly machinery subunit [Arthroderma uncinatum]